MSHASRKSPYEALIVTLLVLLMAAAAWGPFLAKAWTLPFLERPLLFVTSAIALLSLGLLYDAAERFLGGSRGIYVAAAFCSLPAVGFIASEPGSLAIAGAMLTSTLAIWLAVRASGDNRPYFLSMLAALCLFAGHVFGFFPGILGVVFAASLASRTGKKRIITMLLLMLAFIAGILTNASASFGVPTLNTVFAPEGESVTALWLPWLPWTLWILPTLWLRVSREANTAAWQMDAVGALALGLIVALTTSTSMSASAAGVAPVVALLAGDVLYTAFPESLRSRFSFAHALAPLLASLALIALPLASSLSIEKMPTLSWPMTLMCVVLATGIAWTALHRLPRWSFAFLFLAAILFGRFLDTRDPILELGESASSGVIALHTLMFFLAGALILFTLLSVTLGRRLRLPSNPDQQFLFGGENLRRFPPHSDRPNTPSVVELSTVTPESFSFVVFGDVTGAESPLHSRREGFLAFRQLARVLDEFRPRFAVSLGDLATQAARPAYARVRKLLREISVPLAVTPGNHDVVARERYDAAHFHALFGPDNLAFRIGSTGFILLNNAWGSVREEQFLWLEKTLREDSPPFRLIFCHKPLFDPRENEYYAMEDREHAERLHELFRAHSVTAVFSGHIHSLSSHARDGVTYLISGGAGSRPVNDDAPHHYFWVDANRSSLTVRAMPLIRVARGLAATPLLELRFSPRL